MKSFTRKLKLIFVPFLLIAIAITGGYTFLNWLLEIKLHIISLDEDILNFWIPAVLPWIPIFIWLRPKIRLLDLRRKKGDIPSLYIFIVGAAIVVPTIVAQTYLETATGKLTDLNDIRQIDQQAATKYYTLKHFYIDKSHIGVQNAFEVSGKNNEYFNMSLYVALPILTSPADTLRSACLAWYGVKYGKQISNRLSENEKEEQYREFATESQTDFNGRDVNRFIYFDRIGNTSDHKKYIAAVKNNKMFDNHSTVILIPVNEPFENRNGSKFAWIFGTFAIGAAVWLLLIAVPRFNNSALKKFDKGIVTKEWEVKETLGFFIPQKKFLVTPIIMDLNILVFIVMVFAGLGFVSFDARDLLAWGGNYRPATINGEWWRLLTNIFLHGGLMHLVTNMIGLLFVGVVLEPQIGKIKYATAYLVTGTIASLTSLWWHEATVSVGASGAIFGLYGVFLALLVAKIFPDGFSKAFLVSTLIFVGYNLVMGLSGNIDNAAHIGGLSSGFIIGFIYAAQLKSHEKRKGLLMPRTVKKDL